MATKEIQFVDDSNFNTWTGRVFAAIGPSGQLITTFAERGEASSEQGQSPITVHKGAASIHPDFARRGFVLYQDLCMGRVPGVEASPAHWALWQKYVAAMAAGTIFAPGSIPPEKFYHPEVLRRRATAGDGLAFGAQDIKAAAKLLGFDVDPEDAAADLLANAPAKSTSAKSKPGA